MIKSKEIIKSGMVILIMMVLATKSYAEINSEDIDIAIYPILTKKQELWYPGKIESKDFYIINNKEDNISIDKLYMQLELCRNLRTNEILDIEHDKFKEVAEHSIVKMTYKDKLIFESELKELTHEKGIVLSEEIYIKSNDKELLNMTIEMTEEMAEQMDNNSQDLENIFNIGVSYKVDTNTDVDTDINTDINTDIDVGESTDGENGGSGENNFDKLPQTGGLVNSVSLLVLGIITVGIGMILNKKTSNNEGGKQEE